MKHSKIKTTVSAAFFAAVFVSAFSVQALAGTTVVSATAGTSSTAAAAPTYSSCWALDAEGNWIARDRNTNTITDAWFCDDAVDANGKNVWYLLGEDGKMVTAGLVQDATGNFYSLETNHNGYYGMLRYKSGTYDGIYLELEDSHDGSFAAIKNQSGIDRLKEKYGLATVTIGNGNIVYSAGEVRTSSTAGGWHTYANGTMYYYENDKRVKGWREIDGKYYYFDKSTGAMLVKRYTPDGYYVDENGVWDGNAVNRSKITEKNTAKTAAKTASTTKTTSTAQTTSTTKSTSTAQTTSATTSSTKTGTTTSTTTKEKDGTTASKTEPGGSTAEYTERGSDTPSWDSASVTSLKSYVNKATTSMNEAQALYDAGKTLPAGRDKMKKYNQALGKACGALDAFMSIDALLEDRPVLKTSDGSNVAKLSEKSQELIDDLCNLYIDDDTDLDSDEVRKGMAKIQTVLTYLGKIETLAGTL